MTLAVANTAADTEGARGALVRHLRAHGHRVGDVTLQDALRLYLNVLRRRIEVRPRRVVRSAALVAKPAIERILLAIEARSVAGEDLNPFLHRRLFVEPAFEDHTLTTSGLHHLHLGSEAPLRKTGLTKRSREVLFAFATEDTLHFVDVRLHGRRARLETKRARRLCGDATPIDPARDWTLDAGLVELAEESFPGALAASRAARDALTCPRPPSESASPIFSGFSLIGWA